MTPAIKLTQPEPDVAVLTVDLPGKGANVLSRGVLDELSQHLDSLEKRTDLAGLVIISGKPGTFIAGADLREFAVSLDMPRKDVVALCRHGQTLFGRLAATPFVTVAAIDGVCLGGGAELATWCDRRVMSDSPKTQLGFPEVKLGLFPGWGGTVRAPRMVGLGNAAEMVTGGETIDASDARAMGYADDVVPAEDLLKAALAMVRAEQKSRQYLVDRRRWSEPLPIDETELGFLAATYSAMIRQQTKGQYPAPELALEVMLECASLPADEALLQEAEGMAGLFGSPINRALLNVFFLTDRNKKDRGVDRDDLPPRTFESVGVVGAGIMGAGIAAANVKRRLHVVLTDANDAALDRGAQNVLEEVSYDKQTKGPSAARAVEFGPLLNLGKSDQEFAPCDLVIEAVVENLAIKRKVYQRLEPLLRDDAVFASNTSTIPISTLAEGLKRPERFCGIHFFNPVRRMKLVEVIRGEQTSDETVVAAVAHVKKLGKFPVVCNDGPGFLVNRLLLPYMNEALEMLSEGVAIEKIDKAATGFGMPMGPITLYDMVGLDTALYAGKTMAEAFPDRVGTSPILEALVAAGRLGKKSGAGFFSYQNKKRRAEPDLSLDEYVVPHMKAEKLLLTREEITARLFLPMLLEATRALEDGIVRDARDVDLGLIFGIGFPPFKGGLLFWADTLGAAEIVEQLKPLEPLGERAKPTPLLLELAASGGKFYQE
ncbi:MAG: 3-hydroxyacyl-CoA dehydrogenase NAD-binding domain-containing protein [Pirellulaceae bacterium]